MTQIQGLTNFPKQPMNLILPDGTQAPLTLEYIDGQQGWFFTVTYGNFTSSLRRLCVEANLLRAFRGIIPFGLACTTVDGYEPIFVSDFANGRASLFILNSIDVQNVEKILSVN